MTRHILTQDPRASYGFFGVNDWSFVQNWNPEEWFNLNCLLLSNCPGWSLAADLRSVPSSIEHNIIAHHFFRADKNIWMYPRWPCIWLLEWCCWNSCIGKIFVRFSGTPAPEKAWVISFLKTNRSKYRFPSKNQILAPDPPVEEEISASNQFQIVLTMIGDLFLVDCLSWFSWWQTWSHHCIRRAWEHRTGWEIRNFTFTGV